ncbi:MAG: hypothetical protein NNA22_11050 [Nitrospira sp.]|nr:hypothetical protein [Nitrospira sp.]
MVGQDGDPAWRAGDHPMGGHQLLAVVNDQIPVQGPSDLDRLPREARRDALSASTDLEERILAHLPDLPVAVSEGRLRGDEASAPHVCTTIFLEIGDTLKSWAILKGPSLDPTVKRLAVEVEDPDLAYADFEGVIEEGSYGAGPVPVWDTGWFEPIDQGKPRRPPRLCGKWERWMSNLHGHRLRGWFSLVRMKGRPR